MQDTLNEMEKDRTKYQRECFDAKNKLEEC